MFLGKLEKLGAKFPRESACLISWNCLEDGMPRTKAFQHFLSTEEFSKG